LIRSNNLELLTEHPDLEVIVTREDTSTGNSTEDVSTSTLEERLGTFLGNDLTESVERRVILDSGTRGHHHTTTNGINRVRSKTGTGSDSPTKSEGSEERALEVLREHRLKRIVETEVETTVNNDTNTRDVETTIQTSDTIRLEGLLVDIDETLELTLTTLLGGLGIVSETSTSIIQRVDEEERSSTSSTTGSQVTGEPGPVTISVLILVEHTLELILESKVQSLGREVTDNVSSVTSPERDSTLILHGTSETITDTLVRGSETTLLDHFILVLDQELDTLNRGSSGLGDSSGNTTHEEIDDELVVVLSVSTGHF